MSAAQKTPADGQSRIQQSFCRGFQSYNDNAHVQAQIATDLAARFKSLVGGTRFRRAFEFGCGTGFLTRELTRQFSVDHWTLNDLVAECESHVAPLFKTSHCAWNFLSGAVETLDLPQCCDLIASASAIQWVQDTPALLNRLSDYLAPGGWLLLSSFGPGQFYELDDFGSDPAQMSYFDATAWRDMLPKDLVPRHIAQTRQSARFATVRDMLVHLRNTGVNGNSTQNWTRSKLATFEDEYARRFTGPDQKVHLTYAPVYIIAQKTAPQRA
jgi:malonyl-CoA O-methyltransferase